MYFLSVLPVQCAFNAQSLIFNVDLMIFDVYKPILSFTVWQLI